MPKFAKFLSAFGAVLILSPAVFSSELPAYLLYQKDGAVAGDNLSISVAGAGDVNGDGRADFIVGAAYASPGGRVNAGSVYLYSGADGALLYQKDGGMAGDRFGERVASAGDVNGDGKADFIIGAYEADPGGLFSAGSAFVYSGATGALLYQKNGAAGGDILGVSVASTGDVNWDGKDDFIIGAARALDAAGSAFVYSGADGSLLYQKNGAAANDYLGSSVASAGDINADGKADFIIGAPLASPGGLNFAGSAFVYSGADGSLLYQKNGDSVDDFFGASVASAGDVNGDGRADFIIGAYQASPGGLTFAGSAYVYSGADGSLLYQKNGAVAGDYFGSPVASAGDVNGDGRADFIIGAPAANPGGLAFVYSGADGSLLYQLIGAAGDYLGATVASAGDVNGDERADFIVGARFASPSGLTNAGSAYVYGIACAAKGDMNADGSLTASDVVLMLNCVFLGSGNCAPCYADVSCNGMLTSSDVVIELNAVFLGEPITCAP